MRAALAIALVFLAVVGSGCDAVFGSVHVGQVAGREATFSATSDDSGAHPGGTIQVTVCCPTYFFFKVTCLSVVGNRATVGTEVPHAPSDPAPGELWYVEDNPGEGADRLHEEHLSAPPTTCPDPPTTVTNDDSVTGDIHVVDDYDP